MKAARASSKLQQLSIQDIFSYAPYLPYPPPEILLTTSYVQCEKHSKKEEALAKLRDGAKFDDVAREFSEDKARQGGSLGWKVRGSLDEAYEKAAYELEPSTTGNSKFVEVKTGHGYHIIMVEGRR